MSERTVPQGPYLRSLAVLSGWSKPPRYLSVDYSIWPDQQLVSVRLGGVVSSRGIETYMASLRKDPRFHPRFDELIDLRAVDEIHLQPEDLIHFSDELEVFSRESRRAYVVQTEAQMHLARMHQLLMSGRKAIRIFTDAADAEHWLCEDARLED